MRYVPVADSRPLLVIVGPTAVGKTSVAIDLARSLNGEIVSSDSRQVYRRMDIGTAKPAPEERAAVPHHLFDVLDPDENLTLAVFQQMAYKAIDDIHRRSRLPILVGGTGQYVRAVVEGWGVPEVAPFPALRADLASFADVYGPTALYGWLRRVDEPAAQTIDYRNVRRVIRALEVYLVTGTPISVHQMKQPPPYQILQIGLTRPREVLYRRIDDRVDRMMEDGLLAEVRGLLSAGYGWNLSSMASLGYRQFAGFFDGKATLDETVEFIKAETHRFVRHQDTWFRRDDPSIVWFDLEVSGPDQIEAHVSVWLAGLDTNEGSGERLNPRGLG